MKWLITTALLIQFGCSSMPELNGRFQVSKNNDGSFTDGKTAILRFQNDKVAGYYIIGWQPNLNVSDTIPETGMLSIQLLVTGMQPSLLKPRKIQLSKQNQTESTITPEQLISEFRANSMAEIPFEFRMIPSRPAFSIMESPNWLKERQVFDTASTNQKRQRQKHQIEKLTPRFESVALEPYETKVVTLFYRLLVADKVNEYQLIDKSNLIPTVAFRFVEVDDDKNETKQQDESQQAEKLLQRFTDQFQQDLFDLFDEHEQLHQHLKKSTLNDSI